MQKVVGSNPISRSQKGLYLQAFLVEVVSLHPAAARLIGADAPLMAIRVAEPGAPSAPLGLLGSKDNVRACCSGALEGGVDVRFDEIQPGRCADLSFSTAPHDNGITPTQLGVRNHAVVGLNRDGLEAEALDKKAQRLLAVPERQVRNEIRHPQMLPRTASAGTPAPSDWALRKPRKAPGFPT